jgi:hypothetical protein
MPWFTVDDGFLDHPKVLALRSAEPKRWHSAITLWTLAGSWCAKHLTDGAVPAALVEQVGCKPEDADALCACRLWNRVGRNYEFNKWLARNPSRAHVEAARKADADRKRFARESKPASGKRPAGHRTDSDAESVLPIPSHPIPSHPTGENARESSDSDPRRQGLDRRSDGYPPDSLALLLHAAGVGLAGSGAMAEGVAAYLASSGLRGVDSMSHAADLLWLAAKPVPEVTRVLASIQADPWAQQHLGRVSDPRHLRKHWQRYLDGPERAASSPPAERAEYELEATADDFDRLFEVRT